MNFEQSDKLANVLYDVRGPALRRAQQLEEAGPRILKRPPTSSCRT
jgi:alanine-synthesizing transaminase